MSGLDLTIHFLFSICHLFGALLLSMTHCLFLSSFLFDLYVHTMTELEAKIIQKLLSGLSWSREICMYCFTQSEAE